MGARVSAFLMTGVLALLIANPAPSQTDAGWIDPEHGSAAVTALTVPSLNRPSCETKRDGGPRRTAAILEWDPPEGGLPNGMLYEIRANDIPFRPATTKSVFQTAASYRYTDPVGGGNSLPDGTTLDVQIFAVIPNSMTTPKKAVWQSLNPPASWNVRYDRIDSQRGSYSCIED